MTSDPDAISETLRRIAASPSSADKLLVERYQAAGEPAFWEETIAYESGARQRYVRVRSAADEGGAPIGVWDAPADPRALPALARALTQTAIWELTEDTVEPGEELITWRYSLGETDNTLAAPAGSKTQETLSVLDLQLRRIANLLVSGQDGAALVCELVLGTANAQTLTAGVALANRGKQRCLIQNPYVTGNGETDFIKIEVGAPPSDPAGVTGLGIVYEAVPSRLPETLPDPWDAPLIVLDADERLISPMRVTLDSAQYRGFFARAVYSHYGTVGESPEQQVVRGRAFSADQVLSN